MGAAAAELHPQKITSPWRQHGSVSTRSPILRFWTNLGVNQVHHHRALTRWTWVAGRQNASPVTDGGFRHMGVKELGLRMLQLGCSFILADGRREHHGIYYMRYETSLSSKPLCAKQ